jgi:hypothetical protein
MGTTTVPLGKPRRLAVVFWDRSDIEAPDGWQECFNRLTSGSDAGQWGRRAALEIYDVRVATGEGPTFSELFTALMPESGGLPGPFPVDADYPVRRYAVRHFRFGVAAAWANLGWVRWRRDVHRSLDVGPRFRERNERR